MPYMFENSGIWFQFAFFLQKLYALLLNMFEDSGIWFLFACFLQNLYALLLNMLEDRGISQEFMDELLEFSTTFEHKKYISFLEQLQDFVKK